MGIEKKKLSKIFRDLWKYHIKEFFEYHNERGNLSQHSRAELNLCGTHAPIAPIKLSKS